MSEEKKTIDACDEESCKQDLMNGLLAVLAEAEEKNTEK